MQWAGVQSVVAACFALFTQRSPSGNGSYLECPGLGEGVVGAGTSHWPFPLQPFHPRQEREDMQGFLRSRVTVTSMLIFSGGLFSVIFKFSFFILFCCIYLSFCYFMAILLVMFHSYSFFFYSSDLICSVFCGCFCGCIFVFPFLSRTLMFVVFKVTSLSWLKDRSGKVKGT